MRYLSLLLLCMIAQGASIPNDAGVLQWRRDYEESLKRPDGWLSVAGLFWLMEGENPVGSDPASTVVLPNPFPPHAGTLILSGRSAVLKTGAGDQTIEAEKDPVRLGDVSLALLERDHRFAIRLRDPNADSRLHFTGTEWFPPRPEYRMTAKWVPYDPPRTIPILTILGYTEQQPTPGYAEFSLFGHTYRLEPVIEDPTYLFFMFKDKTTGHETYGAGRFLKSDNPAAGEVVLDFNKAYNPPCAYTAYATCPLPPKQNVLPIRVEAGQLKYGKH